jgi:hypothetical protein
MARDAVATDGNNCNDSNTNSQEIGDRETGEPSGKTQHILQCPIGRHVLRSDRNHYSPVVRHAPRSDVHHYRPMSLPGLMHTLSQYGHGRGCHQVEHLART